MRSFRKASCVTVVISVCVITIALFSSPRQQASQVGVLIGTHNSVTGEEGYGLISAIGTPFAVCQDKTLADQHAAGARYFDLRVRKTTRGWVCAHGLWESRRAADDILAQLSSYSNTLARIWYEGNAPTGFVAQVELWKRRYRGIEIVEAGSRNPWRTLKTWRNIQTRHDYLGLDFSSWHTLLPIPWLWKRIYHNQPTFDTSAYTVVDFL